MESNNFQTAIDCYEKLYKMIIDGFDLDAKLDDVGAKYIKFLEKAEEKRRLDEVLQSEEIELITQFLKDYPMSPKKQELEGKLSSLKVR